MYSYPHCMRHAPSNSGLSAPCSMQDVKSCINILFSITLTVLLANTSAREQGTCVSLPSIKVATLETARNSA